MENFTAEDARKITDAANNKEYSEIVELIKSAAAKGDSCIYLYRNIDKHTKNKLEENSFLVSEVYDNSIIIRWD